MHSDIFTNFFFFGLKNKLYFNTTQIDNFKQKFNFEQIKSEQHQIIQKSVIFKNEFAFSLYKRAKQMGAKAGGLDPKGLDTMRANDQRFVGLP